MRFAGAGERDDEGSPIAFACGARDQVAGDETIEHAGEGGSFVREGAVERGDGRLIGFGQMTQDMRFGLRQIGHVASDVESDAVGGAMNSENELKGLRHDTTISYYPNMNNMSDAEFVRAFEACEIPGAEFHHRDHIRLAWIYHHCHGALAGARIAASIRNYAAHLGVSGKYHETITQAWMQLVVSAAGPARDFDAFIAEHPELLDKSLLAEFYSEEILGSQEARERFIEPDRKSFSEGVLGRSAAGVLK